MNLFATGVLGHLRVVLSSLSIAEGSMVREDFFLGFYDERALSNSSYASHISIPIALARSVVPIGIPSSPTEHEATIDAVVLSPVILDQIRSMAATHPLLLNISMQVDALSFQADLDHSTALAPLPRKSGYHGQLGGPL
jgi:hypothetical protein